MTSTTPADSPRAAAAPAPVTSQQQQQQHQPNTVGFQTKKMVGVFSPAAAHTGISPERMAYLEATLAKLPELDLSEMARVKTCFASVLGEGRENIVNGLELRVVLGDLGLYPSEEELTLVLRAYRDRVNLVGLARYLRLYKKEFWLNQVAARSRTQSRQPAGQPAPASQQQQGGAGRLKAEGTSGMPNTYTAFSGSHARPAGGAAAGSGNDEDTLKAFVALGGEEDGSGEIAAATLRDAVRGFGLTLDIDAMIQTVDVHHSGMLDYVDFCALWATPADGSGAHGGGGVDSMGNALRQASADAERRASVGGSPFPMGGANRRLLSVLTTPSHRASLVAGALQRRSQMLSLGNDTGASQPISPRLAAGNGNRPPTSERLGKDANGAERVNNGHNAVGVYAPVIAAAVPEPITEEEHALLVRMFLFPEQFDTVAASSTTSEPIGRRANNNNANNTRFTLPSKNAQPLSPSKSAAAAMNGGNNPAPNGVLARRASVSQRAAANSTTASLQQQQQQQLSRSGKAAGSRSGSQKRRGNKTNAGGTRGRKANSGNNDFGDEDDLAADFFSPKNQNVYRPPSPMLLSMRNSTAYRNRVKRLEGQKHAARGDAPQQQQRGLHAATVARDGGAGGYGYGGADGDGVSRQTKSSTW